MEPNDLKKRFVGIYGGDESDLRVFSAAGRVNLIGEHIDYCGGKVSLRLSTSAQRWLRAKRRKRYSSCATTIDDRVTLDISNLNAYRDLKWGDYQAGVAYVNAASRLRNRRLRPSLRYHRAVRIRTQFVRVHSKSLPV